MELVTYYNTSFMALESGKYHCLCGSILKRSSIRGHLNSKKHRGMSHSSTTITLKDQCFTVLPSAKLSCPCGSVLSRRSVHSHLKTKKHLSFTQTVEEPNPIEGSMDTTDCSICYEPSTTFKKCSQCIHSVCNTCSNQLNRCPFCRKDNPYGDRVLQPDPYLVERFRESLELLFRLIR